MRTKRLLLSVIGLLACLTVSAHDVKIGEIYYNLMSDKTAEVASNSLPNKEDVVIPETINVSGVTYTVVGIYGKYWYDEFDMAYHSVGAFQNCSNLTSISLPQTIGYIGPYSFRGSNLTSVTIPNSVKNIGNGAFFGCNGLASVIIGNSVTSIEEDAFKKCNNLKEVTCTNTTVPSLQNTSFEFGNITLYVPAESIEKYDSQSPWNKFRFIKAIGTVRTDYKYKMTYIVDDEEYKVEELEEGELISSSYPRKEGYTFREWIEIPRRMPAHDVTVTASFTVNKYKLTYKVDGDVYKSYDIEYDAPLVAEEEPTKKAMVFSGWSSIPETMPARDVVVSGSFSSTVTNNNVIYQVSDNDKEVAAVIGNDNATGSVTIISTVDFDKTYPVTAINAKAFYGCAGITTIEIPATITSIGERAFANIDKLTDVTCLAAEIPETDRTAFENSYIEDYVTLHVPESAVDKYKTTAPWKNFKEIVGIAAPPEPSKCATPSVSIVNGKMLFACETEGVTYHYNVSCSFEREGDGDNIELDNVYKVIVYASKEGYTDSEVLTKEVSASQLDYDLNGDKKINVSDIVKMVNLMLEGK